MRYRRGIRLSEPCWNPDHFPKLGGKRSGEKKTASGGGAGRRASMILRKTKEEEGGGCIHGKRRKEMQAH